MACLSHISEPKLSLGPTSHTTLVNGQCTTHAQGSLQASKCFQVRSQTMRMRSAGLA